MFFLARRRRDFGWFSIQALGALLYPLFATGLTQPLGPVDIGIMGSALTAACISSVYFTHEVFNLGQVHKAFPIILMASVLSTIVFHSPFEAVPRTLGTVGSVELVVVYQLVRLGRLSLKRSMNAFVFLCAWVLLGCLAFIDLHVFAGLAPWAGGVRLAGVGLTLFVVMQVVGLSREFLTTLVVAERKATLLEKQQVEVQRLNSELKFQIAERSKALAEALCRLGESKGHLDAGVVVGSRYRVNGFIGAGAMGRVYKVTRVTDELQFALKVMSDTQTGSSAVRFVREAQILCNANHENVVGVIDAGIDERGLLFLVLELVNGLSLDEGQRFHEDPALALEVIRQVAQGLASLHGSNIVHRDLKPGNILIATSPNGIRVKLTDFGISTHLSSPASDATPKASTSWLGLLGGSQDGSLTQTGTVLGTPAFIAPELAGTGSAAAEPSSDIFSLGVIAYELLTGKRPWEEPAIILKLKGQGPTPVDLAVACPELPLSVAQSLMRAISWEPHHRPTADEIALLIAPKKVMLPERIISVNDQTRKDRATPLWG
jgi:hypothetical protein